jgi:aconitate hydratase
MARPDALARNMALEVERNKERFSFVKWAMHAYDGIRLIPPGFGILHQINLEYFAPGLLEKDGAYYPDTLVGTDSHTCMIAGLGHVGWGVGGIEAEAAMLAQPVYMLTPDVIGVNVVGKLSAGVTSTDMVLTVTEMLRAAKVVGKFVEFFGEGVASLTVPDRATIANMSPEYGATIGFFPVDEQTLSYLRQTGRPEAQVAAMEAYYRMQGCFGSPRLGAIDYTRVLTLDLASIAPSVAGPKRPQDRVALAEPQAPLRRRLAERHRQRRLRQDRCRSTRRRAGWRQAVDARDGDVVIAAITSVHQHVQSRRHARRGPRREESGRARACGQAVGQNLARAGFGRRQQIPRGQRDSNAISISSEFAVVGYSCTDLRGRLGPDCSRPRKVDRGKRRQSRAPCCRATATSRHASIQPCARRFWRVLRSWSHSRWRARSTSISPPSRCNRRRGNARLFERHLADGGRARGRDAHGGRSRALPRGIRNGLRQRQPAVDGAAADQGRDLTPWEDESTYIKEPPFLTDAGLTQSSLRSFSGARALAILGNSITTDHISPIGSIKTSSPPAPISSAMAWRRSDFQQLRRAPHEPRGDGARRICQRQAQKPDGSRRGRRRDPAPAERRADDHFRCRDALRRGKRSADRHRRRRIRNGQRARLGRRKAPACSACAQSLRLSFERIHRSNLVGMGVCPASCRPA